MIYEKQLGKILNNTELCEIFKCPSQGRIKRSLKTKILILESNHIKSIYDDIWIDNILH
jgi:5-methylcytosine-specific restriction protein A